eukprot:c39937_g1_i1 orf=53-262(+)
MEQEVEAEKVEVNTTKMSSVVYLSESEGSMASPMDEESQEEFMSEDMENRWTEVTRRKHNPKEIVRLTS